MAVTVTDNRAVLYSDGLTNITGASATETSFFAEAASCAAEAYNIATGQIYWSGTTPNFTTAGNELIYVWSAVVATQNGFKEATPADSSHASYISDGTNQLIIYQAGNDRDVFKHADGQVSFQCFLVDIDYLSTLNTNGDLAAIAGSFGAFNAASTTMDVGAHYTTLSKALGGGDNCYMDIIRYGGIDDGITIAGGTTGDRGNFAEVAVLDRSTADGRAHGILREYTGGAYGCQGTLNIGDAGTAQSWFDQDGFSLTFENRPVADDKYKLLVQGNGTSSSNVFRISNATIASARPAVLVDMSSNNINELILNSCAFQNMINGWTFPTDTNGTTRVHEARQCTWTNQGIVFTGSILMNNCTFTNAADANGAVEWDTATDVDNQTNTTFNSDGTGHAIHINIDTAATTTYNIDGYLFDNYARQDGTAGNRVFLITNPSDGDIVINLSNTTATNPSGGGTGNTISFELAAGTTSNVTINNNVTLTLTGIETDSEVRIINLDDVTNFNRELTGNDQIEGSLQSATIVNGGSGYTNGTQTLTVVGGTGTAAQVEVTVAGGVVTSINSITVAGSYTDNPSNPAATTGGGGTGCTLNLRISGEFTYSYDGGSGFNVAIIVFHLDFVEVRIEQVLPAVNSSIPIQQRGDRVYNNP